MGYLCPGLLSDYLIAGDLCSARSREATIKERSFLVNNLSCLIVYILINTGRYESNTIINNTNCCIDE